MASAHVMQLIRRLPHARAGSRGCVLAIGNFDGVHLGHQAVIREVRRMAGDLGVPSAVMIFEPQPREFLAPERAPARLTTLREKLEAFREQQVDEVICLRFDGKLARLSDREFVERLLVRGLSVKQVVVGEDFRYGHNRQGDLGTLQQAGVERGFGVYTAATLRMDGERISSSRIRAALAAGDLEGARALLGRPYRISGRVIRGAQRGRRLGFPTANVDVERRRSPLHGVFAVRVDGVNGRALEGVANVGTRPVYGGGPMLLEVYLFDFEGEIYGQRIHVEFLRRLREERNFDSEAHLLEQMHRDAEEARAFFAAGAAR